MKEGAAFREKEIAVFWAASKRLRQLLEDGGSDQDIADCLADVGMIRRHTGQRFLRLACNRLLVDLATREEAVG